MQALSRRSSRPTPAALAGRWILAGALALGAQIPSVRAQDASPTDAPEGAGGEAVVTSEEASEGPSEPDDAPAIALPAPSIEEGEGEDPDEIPAPPEGYDEGSGIEFVPTPPTPLSAEEARAAQERSDDALLARTPPPPMPEWRIRVGGGVGIPVSGSSTPMLRLHEELEFQPEAAAPFVFGIGGAEYLLGGTFGSVGARLGMASSFCEVGVVRCQGGVHIVLGAFLGEHLAAFDVGGEGDVRFLFSDVFELSLRGGFDGGGDINLIHIDVKLKTAF